MSKEIAIGIVIGGAVSASLGAAVGRTGTLVSGLKKKLADTRDLQATIGKTQELQRNYAEAFRTGAKDADLLRGRLDKQHQALKAAGIDVANLEKEYKRLGRTVKGIEWQSAGAEKMKSGAELGRGVGSGLALSAVPTKMSGDFQAEIRDIAIKGTIAGSSQEQQMVTQIRQAAKRQNMDRTDLARAVNGLVTQGMDWKESTGYGDLLGELTIGQKMDPEDAAKLIYAFRQNGVTQAQMRKVMGEVAVAGDLGAFEADKMAKFLPELLATVGSMGLRGQSAVRFLSASLQAQIKLTGDADSAANNFKNLLSKIISPDTAGKFKNAGVDLQSSMTAYMKAGYNPVDAFLALTERLIVKSDPARAKRMAELKRQVQSSAGNSKEEAEALNAYLQSAGLGDIISDMQARSAALAQIKYGGQIKSDQHTMRTTDGEKKLAADKRARDETSNRKWETVSNDFGAAMTALGDAIRPATDGAADLAAAVLKLGTSLTQSHPWVGMAALAGGVVALGFAATKIAAGATQWVAGKALERIAGRGLGKTTGRGRGGKVASALESVLGGGGGGEQRVFVTNWPAGGGGVDLPDGGGEPKGGGKASKAGRFSLLGGALKGAGGFMFRHAGTALAVGAAAYQVYDTAANAKTAEEKGRGYGGGAGSLVGGLAGAKLGAVIGTMIAPGIGTAVGGLLGGAIGTFAGTKMGSALGAALTGGAKKPVVPVPPKPAAQEVDVAAKAAAKASAAKVPVVAAAATAAAHSGARPGAAADARRVITNVFRPVVQVTVKGDVKDPRQIANEIAPFLRQIFDGWQRQTARSAMYDSVD